MKKIFIHPNCKECLLILVLLFFANFSNATNPPISNFLTNLSQGLLSEEYEDFHPEMIIEGNTIHVVWANYVGNKAAYLFYCRSTDLGETWGQPKQLYQYKEGSFAKENTAQKMAVSGNNVYIGIADYDYSNNGTGYIYIIKSTNGGAGFSTPVELANSGGGYKSLNEAFIRAKGDNVAIAYSGSGNKEGIRLLFSSDKGVSFSESVVTEENNNMSDFLYKDNTLIVIHEYYYYYYGLNTGRVYASVSTDNGASFTTNKVSVTYTNDYGEKEQCRCYHGFTHYVPKVAKDGNNIHLIFVGNINQDTWTILYARSGNNGQTFEDAVDINNGHISNIESGQENVVAKNGQVYMEYSSDSKNGGKIYLVRSEDNGANLSGPQSLLTENTHYIKTTWFPQLVIDPSDETGKTVYFGADAMMTRKSTDGGKSFHNTAYLFPLFDAHVKNSSFKIDQSGGIHWLSKGRFNYNYDYDIFYGSKKAQPGPGGKNKAYHLETTWNDIQETSIVPSSPSIEFDSVITAEAWVKININESGNLNLFAKINGAEGYNNNPSGYQMGVDKGYWSKKLYPVAAVETDKGDFVIEADDYSVFIEDSLWHHFAFTYDAKAGLNNFKLYFDGLLVSKKTVTGHITSGDGLFIIGSRSVGQSNSNYFIDNIRLWNRALTQEELIENQTKEFTGNEEGLKLWLIFDDTFKDMSGNGNDAIPLYLGNLESSDFEPPLTDFDMYQVINEVSFNNKTTKATSWLWDFGDEATSELGNPKYTYATAGEYNISLLSKNKTTVTSDIGHVTIAGLDRVEPAKAGNAGVVTLTVFGGGLTPEGTNIILQKEGSEDIEGADIYSPGKGQLSAYFLLDGAELGNYNVVVRKNNVDLVIEDGFTVVEAIMPDPWVSTSGRGLILFNMWQTYTINYGNNGNVDALGVPLNFVISDLPGMEIEFIDFKIEANGYMKENTPGIVGLMDTLYEHVEDYFGPGLHARYYPLYIPIIEANNSKSIHVRIKSPNSFQMETWMNEPFFSIEEGGDTKSAEKVSSDLLDQKSKLNACIALSAADALSASMMDVVGMVLPVDCLYDFGTLALNPWDIAKPEHEKSEMLQNWGYSLASAAFSCIGDLTPIKAIKIGIKITSILNNIYKGWKMHQDCLRAFDPKYKSKKGVTAVGSLDPNEMVGPTGYGGQNYIAGINFIPYTILFENKSEATAPAHIVTISDTLCLNSFNISDFGFGEFGWGDTIFSPQGQKMKEFSMDIDMRPGLELITRVSGKLDTLTGVVNWEFISLNPTTMELEEDPFIGFLPPNKTSPEGEGFVSFSVGVKKELNTNAEIRNKASIVFDANEPIITNQYLNTLDLTPPQSQVYPLESEIKSNFNVSWTGTDEGSGISGYSIYVLENDTLLYPWLTNTSQLTEVFHGELNSSYKFYSIAFDNVSHIEGDPAQYDATTKVTVDTKGFEMAKEELLVYPNPVEDKLRVKITNPPCGVFVIELVGVGGSLCHSQIYDDFELQQGININVENYDPGQYLVRIVYGNVAVSRKIVVQ